MLEVRILDEAIDFIQKLPKKQQVQVAEKIAALARTPAPVQSKQLAGFAPLRRLRAGKFRIVYFIDRNVLHIPLVDTRNDDKVYRRLRNLFT